MVDHDVFVVIPAAGSGERLGSFIPKQYCKILGKPLLLYAVEQFLSFSLVRKIALVVDNIEKAHTILQEAGLDGCKRLILVKGGPSRHRSIQAGLLKLEEYSSDLANVVVVHDGVRPLVPERLVVELCGAAQTHGAAGAIRPLVSTVLRATCDLFLDASLDRATHVASHTPQAFIMRTLLQAYRKI
ncbi:D-ribitol-5-phosphate cytidylyltransferase-like isoform X2 [Nilaparvata lugens]|uniref:D-ribitol-5-phosphate cytidylyltransferase-like isoform X2 n=1 Tax=Nilaparvata lugens TaxID=108931 RepID=UPI00193D0094|nr:D-ribitol-5-phosphate cytidylyltransferase-like isoform X2 [Nilaparvata lugens]